MLTQVPPNNFRSMTAIFIPALDRRGRQRWSSLSGSDDNRVVSVHEIIDPCRTLTFLLCSQINWRRRAFRTDSLFNILKPEALYDRPVAERHRVVFYLGHLEAFDWNLLGGKTLHPEFDKLFAFGIDPVGTGLPADQPKDWPSIAEIRSYNAQVRSAIDAMPASDLMLNVAIEHRLMHAETLAYMFHQMPLDTKLPQVTSRLTAEPVKSETIFVPAGSVVLGRSEGFGWDNEFDAPHRGCRSF